MSKKKDTVGLIAGGGPFPLLLAEAAGGQGYRVVAVAHRDETDPILARKVDEIVWVSLGQLGHIINALKQRGVRRAFMAGTISKGRMFSRIRPDLKGLSLVSRLAIFHDDGILRAVANELEKEGIEIISSTVFLPDLLAPAGCLTKRKPTRDEMADIQFGWRIAKEMGKLDIGQCVVVRRKTVLAVEAMEGTDETIRRGGGIAREKAVVVKVSKPRQDLRFDVPAVGLNTLSVMADVKATVLAVEAGKTLLFDRPAMIQYAEGAGISIVCHAE